MSTTELSRSTLESKDKDELHQIANAMGVKPGSRARKAEIVDLILDLAGPRPTAPVTEPSAKADSAKADSAKADSAKADSAKADSAKAKPSNGKAATASTRRPAAVKEAAAFSFDPMADARAEAASKRSRDTGEEAPSTDAPASGPSRSKEDATTASDASRSDVAKSNAGTAESKSTEASGREDAGAAGSTIDGEGASNATADAGGSNNDGRGRSNSSQQNTGQQNSGQQNNNRNNNNRTNNDDAGGESGNRKRRRRGRNRDREQGSSAPQEDWDGEPIDVAGYLDLRDDGYGFLRVKGVLPSKDDVYVPVKQARQYGLRKGDYLKGTSRPAGRSEKNPALLRLDEVNGLTPDEAQKRPRFEDLTPLFPDEKLKLERADDPSNMTARIVDLIAPIGKGQRGLIVSPPKAGKTTIMKEIARSIEMNNPEVKLLVLLVDERPEEVTDMRRWLKGGDVIASTFDRPSDEHTMVAELTIERAKRMVEAGEDVVIILDGITRLARAYNLAAPATGRIMSGGVDSGALYPPKRFFGAARNVEEGGSLTILATALVETGSKMDEVIFEEFKGTGNMELRLDRKTAERRIYPAIDVDASSTRHEELLFERKQLQQVWKLRRVLTGMAAEGANASGLDLLIDRLKTFNNNEEFLAEVARGPGN